MLENVKIKRLELLAIVKENRAQHRKIFEEAIVGYREQAIKELEVHIQEARDGKRVKRSVSIPEPIDQTREYDKAIRMLELSVDDVIELDHHGFSNLVLDDWHWKQNFIVANSTYSKTANDIIAATQNL